MKNSLRLFDDRKIKELWVVVSSAQTPQSAPLSPANVGWKGWVPEAKEILVRRKDRAMPYKDLQQRVVDLFFKFADFSEFSGSKPARCVADLTMLASLPDEWLSEDSNLVSVPEGEE